MQFLFKTLRWTDGCGVQYQQWWDLFSLFLGCRQWHSQRGARGTLDTIAGHPTCKFIYILLINNGTKMKIGKSSASQSLWITNLLVATPRFSGAPFWKDSGGAPGQSRRDPVCVDQMQQTLWLCDFVTVSVSLTHPLLPRHYIGSPTWWTISGAHQQKEKKKALSDTTQTPLFSQCDDLMVDIVWPSVVHYFSWCIVGYFESTI